MSKIKAEDTAEKKKTNKKPGPISRTFEDDSNIIGGLDAMTYIMIKESELRGAIYRELIPPKVDLIIEKTVKTNQKNILSYWRKVNILNPTIGPKDIEKIAIYCYGLTKIIEYYPASKYSKMILSKEEDCVTGLNLTYKFVQEQLNILKNLPEAASSIKVLNYLEVLIQSVIIFMFKEIEPKKIISADPRLLHRIVESIDSQTQGTRFKSLIQLKKLLADTSLHHAIFVSFAQTAKKKQMNKLKYILQYYNKERGESSITNKLISSIVQKIYCSKSASAKLDSWTKDIKESKFTINVSKEEEESINKHKNANYWQEKYFIALNEKDDINNKKRDKAGYLNIISELQYKNNVLEKNSDDALNELTRSFDVISDIMRASSPLKSYTQDLDSTKDEEYFTDIGKRANNIKKFPAETGQNWYYFTVLYIVICGLVHYYIRHYSLLYANLFIVICGLIHYYMRNYLL